MTNKKYPIVVDLIYIPGKEYLNDPPRVKRTVARETKKYYFVVDGHREMRFEKNDRPFEDPEEIAFNLSSPHWGSRSIHTIRLEGSKLAQQMAEKAEKFYMANQSIELINKTIKQDISNPVIAEVYKLLRDQGENHVN